MLVLSSQKEIENKLYAQYLAFKLKIYKLPSYPSVKFFFKFFFKFFQFLKHKYAWKFITYGNTSQSPNVELKSELTMVCHKIRIFQHFTEDSESEGQSALA